MGNWLNSEPMDGKGGHELGGNNYELNFAASNHWHSRRPMSGKDGVMMYSEKVSMNSRKTIANG